jgi:hypothetical protein
MKPKVFWIPGPWRGCWRKAGLDVVVFLLEKDEAEQLELNGEGVVAESNGV